MQAVRSALKEVSPQTPLGLVESWDEHLGGRTAEPRLLMTTLTAFGALAGFLAALGVYGLFSWSVALRRRELAIRLTLGARPAGRRRQRASPQPGPGGDRHRRWAWRWSRCRAACCRRSCSASPRTTPTSLVTGAALLLVAALVASLPPAWRAMQVDPVEGLRAE